MKKNQKRPSGGAQLALSGKRPVLIGLTPAQHQKIRDAADADGRPMTQFLTYHGLVAAEKILKKAATTLDNTP